MSTLDAGGRIGLVYALPAAAVEHTLHLHVCPFDPTPVTTVYGTNDRMYVSGGPVTPSETSVLETWTALARLWQPYYGAHWTLRFVELKQTVDDTYVYLANQPAPSPVSGTSSGDDDTGPRLNRAIRLLSPTGVTRRFYLNQVLGLIEPRHNIEITPSTGGLDLRDRAWMAYLSGQTGGAAVMPDGNYCFPVSDMDVFWARPLDLEAGTAGASAVDAFGTVSTDCLTFPRGATFCNDVDGAIHLGLPPGNFTFDATGITFPGGHRLEAVSG